MEEEYRLKIGEMAEFFDVSVKTLRLYDKINLFTPGYTDPQTGYRYYVPSQFNRLNTILSFKNVGFALKDIKNIFDKNLSCEELCVALQQKRSETRGKIDALQLNIEALDGMIRAAENKHVEKNRLTDMEQAREIAKIACVDNIKFENIFTDIFWL